MGIWQIDKEFAFEYGHRVWNQTLDSKLSDNSQCKCRYLHGHSGRIKVGLSGTQLKDGMVLDFNNLKFFKKWIDDNLDHKTIMDINDPMLKKMIPEWNNLWLFDRKEKFWTIITSVELELIQQEFFDSFVIVNFVPTSENFSKWFFDIIKEELKEEPVRVAYVDFYETAKSHSRYSEGE